MIICVFITHFLPSNLLCFDSLSRVFSSLTCEVFVHYQTIRRSCIVRGLDARQALSVFGTSKTRLSDSHGQRSFWASLMFCKDRYVYYPHSRLSLRYCRHLEKGFISSESVPGSDHWPFRRHFPGQIWACSSVTCRLLTCLYWWKYCRRHLS